MLRLTASPRRLLALLALTLAPLVGCGGGAPIRPVVMQGNTQELLHVAAGDAALARQLDGHLARVATCWDEARAREATASGLLEARFTIEPDGHVSGTSIDGDTSGDPSLTACVSTRLAALYFDPAPSEAVHLSHAFVFCSPGDEGFCGLGPVVDAEGRAPADGHVVAAFLHDQSREMRHCAGPTQEGSSTIVSVEVTVNPDGRVMSGRVRDATPRASAFAACAIRPLLGARIESLSPAEPRPYRHTFLIEARPEGMVQARR